MIKVKPSQTDSRITAFNDDIYCYAPTNPKGKLLIALPGSGAKPSGMTAFMEVAEGEGYHVIGLSYPNTRGNADCKAVPKPTENYLDNFCREVLFGEKLSTLTEVDVVNCIESRAISTLLYLADNFRDEGWNQFFDDEDDIFYDDVTVVGHSQGGSHALKWAEHRKLQRAIGLSSPREVCPAYKSSWGKFETPLEDCYFFTHVQDNITSQDALIKRMGIIEPYVDTYMVDKLIWRNYLVTSKPVKDSKTAHACTMTDIAFVDVWKYLLK